MTFSAEARVIAAFTFTTALLFGGWAAVGGFAGSVLSWAIFGFTPDVVLCLAYLAIALITVLVLVLARHAAAQTGETWARHLGQATVLLAGLLTLGATAAGLIALV